MQVHITDAAGTLLDVVSVYEAAQRIEARSGADRYAVIPDLEDGHSFLVESLTYAPQHA